jgi:hypothetical protein
MTLTAAASNPATLHAAVKRTLAQQRGPRLAGLYCRASWHLRENPRAIAIYDLAIQLSNGGATAFYCSIRQLASYFGWSKDGVSAALAECEAQGFLVRTRTGQGGRPGQPDFANEYEVRTHAQVAAFGEHCCLKDDTTRPAKQDRSVKRTALKNRTGVSCSTGLLCPDTQHSTCPAGQDSVFDLESSMKSTTESTNEQRDARHFQNQNPGQGEAASNERTWADDALEEELELMRSLHPELVTWVAAQQPLKTPLTVVEGGDGSPLILPYTEGDGEYTEASASENYERVLKILYDNQIVAQVHVIHLSMFIDYSLIWDLDIAYGQCTSVRLAEMVLKYCPQDRSLIYDRLGRGMFERSETRGLLTERQATDLYIKQWEAKYLQQWKARQSASNASQTVN